MCVSSWGVSMGVTEHRPALCETTSVCVSVSECVRPVCRSLCVVDLAPPCGADLCRLTVALAHVALAVLALCILGCRVV